MGNTIDRRRFLQGLVGLGAAVVLPAQASAEQVDAEWARLVADPWYFLVDDHGTLVENDDGTPKVNGDVYDISTQYITTVDDLIFAVDEYDELRSHFEYLADCENGDCEDSDEIADWEAWIRREGTVGLPRFRALIDTWLDSEVDWQKSELWPHGWHTQHRVMDYFVQMGSTVCEALGVVVIEGECPGSSYYAAELRQGVDTANRSAEKIGLPFRFKAG